MLQRPPYDTLLLGSATLMLAALLVYVNMLTYHWPIQHDNACLYYEAYRVVHGDVPYKDFFALDMPASILIHALGIVLFGEGDIEHRNLYTAWQIFIVASCMIFFGKGARLAGLIAGLFYGLYHLSTGIDQMLQREYLMLPFLLLGGAFIMRDGKYLSLSGAMTAIACMIKPVAAIYGILLLALRIFNSPRRFLATAKYFAAGGLAVAGPIILWLFLTGSLGDFIDVIRYYFPIYRSMGHSPSFIAESGWYIPFFLWGGMMSIPLISRGDKKAIILIIGCIYGLCNYFLQPFNFPHRHVPVRFFFMLLCFYAANDYWQHYGPKARILLLALLATLCWIVSPAYWNNPNIIGKHTPLNIRNQMIADIMKAQQQAINRNSLEFSMQFMDITEGIYYAATVLRTKLPSRCVYPPIFYYADENVYVKKLQNECMTALEQNPPQVITTTTNSFPFFGSSMFVLRNNRLAALLANHYTLIADRPQYRVYSRHR